MARRHIDDPGAWLKAFGDNPRLHLSRPAPLASPPRLNELAPSNKSIATIRSCRPSRRRITHQEHINSMGWGRRLRHTGCKRSSVDVRVRRCCSGKRQDACQVTVKISHQTVFAFV
jgi:hypothetical protein